MIVCTKLGDNILNIQPHGLLAEKDFVSLRKMTDPLIEQYGKIRLLVDASKFKGWDSIAASQKHFAFVKGHHKKVERVAIIVSQKWQFWLANSIKLFLHPEVKTFSKNEEEKALLWIRGSK